MKRIIYYFKYETCFMSEGWQFNRDTINEIDAIHWNSLTSHIVHVRHHSPSAGPPNFSYLVQRWLHETFRQLGIFTI